MVHVVFDSYNNYSLNAWGRECRLTKTCDYNVCDICYLCRFVHLAFFCGWSLRCSSHLDLSLRLVTGAFISAPHLEVWARGGAVDKTLCTTQSAEYTGYKSCKENVSSIVQAWVGRNIQNRGSKPWLSSHFFLLLYICWLIWSCTALQVLITLLCSSPFRSWVNVL